MVSCNVVRCGAGQYCLEQYCELFVKMNFFDPAFFTRWFYGDEDGEKGMGSKFANRQHLYHK